MANNIRRFLGTLILFTFPFIVGGCSNDTGGTTTPTKAALAAATNLAAYSRDTTSVGLKWTPSADASKADFASYQITVKQGSSTVKTETASKSDSTTVVTGLASGIYTFELVSVATSSSTTYSNSSAVSVTWAPANRYTYDERIVGRDIKVYETNSSLGGSGLVFSKPKVVSVSTPGAADSLLIDIYVQTDPVVSSKLNLRSIHQLTPTRYTRITRFSTVQRDLSTLDDPRSTPPDSTTYTLFEVGFDSVVVAGASGKCLYFKGNNGNYGRLLLKRTSGGNLVWGGGRDQYLNFDISYQTQPYNPFAKPFLTNSGLKRSAQ